MRAHTQLETRETGVAGLATGRTLTTTAVIPALDEEASIGRVLDAIPWSLVDEVIVVDGGSRDGTVGVAAGRGARILAQERRGYGSACALGVREARGDVVVLIDADGAADPREIGRLLDPLVNEGVDLVLGSRLAGRIAAGAMPWHQRAGNRLCAFLIRLLYGAPLTDLAPFRAVRRGRLLDLTLKDVTYGWPTEMIVKAVRAGWRIAEVPVSSHPRTAGRSKISGTVRGTVLASTHLLYTILRHVRA